MRRPTTQCAGRASFAAARRAMDNLAAAGFGQFKISVVMTRQNVPQLDALAGLAEHYGAQLRLTRLRPSGRGADTWEQLHPTAAQQRDLYHWLIDRPDVLTGDSFFHLSALGDPLEGLNLCGAGRVVCLIDPVGDVYACPFVIHDEFLAGSVRDRGGFAEVWAHSPLFEELRSPQSAGACASCGSFDACQGGCMAAKFFTGLPLDGPDPECVLGHGETALAALGAHAPLPSVRTITRVRSRSGSGARDEPRLGRRRGGQRGPVVRLMVADQPTARLERLAWPQVDGWGRTKLVVLPSARSSSTAPPPLDTDTRMAQSMADALAEARSDVTVAPPIAYGSSGEHAHFAGTLSMGTRSSPPS